MLEKSKYTLCKYDKNNKLIYVNDSFLMITGWQYHEVMGKKSRSFCHPDVPESYERFIAAKIDQQGFFNGYSHCIDKYGKSFWLFVDIGGYFGNDGELLGHETIGYTAAGAGVNHFQLLLDSLLAIERKDLGGVDKAYDHLLAYVQSMDVDYDEFVCTIQGVS